jgi:cell division protein FtsI (penicillin-binding protein 3)
MLAKLRDEDLSDGADDHIGEPLPEESKTTAVAQTVPSKPSASSFMSADFKQAASKQTTPVPATTSSVPLSDPNPAPARGTVVVDVEGGQVVPSLVGMPLRSAVMTAQQAGFELAILGNGVAREQTPAAGSRVPAGSKIAVRFTR